MLRKAIKYAILAFILHRLGLLIISLGFHKTAYTHHPGKCRVIQAMVNGSEDMERIPGDKVLITNGLRFNSRYRHSYAGRYGRVYMFDFNYPDADPEEVTISNYPGDIKEADFHGISSWVNPDTGVITVFIVNHDAAFDTVEIFTYNDGENTLYHKKSVKEDSFRLLNDVVAVSDEAFYTTKYQYFRYKWSLLEGILRFKWGAILFYDGQNVQVAADGFFLPNGINRSPNGRYIYLVHIGTAEICVFERQKNNSLIIKQTWPTHTGHDNIIVEPETGHLWLGCHPLGWKAMIYLEEPSHISPSQVLRLTTKNGLITGMTEPFSDDGHLISGSSVAVYAKDKLLIGSIVSQTVICDADSDVINL